MMMEKINEKLLAIQLRKSGHTYREILQEINVAKSTLSLWLREVGLCKPQQQKITQKRMDAQKRGGEARRNQKEELIKQIHEDCKNDIINITDQNLFLMGIMLYWAEGSKEKRGKSTNMQFVNTDPRMITLFMKWMNHLSIPKDQLTFKIYIHITHTRTKTESVKYWSKCVGFDITTIVKFYFKAHNPKTNRRYDNNNYYGLLAVTVKKSSHLVRKVEGWVRTIMDKL